FRGKPVSYWRHELSGWDVRQIHAWSSSNPSVLIDVSGNAVLYVSGSLVFTNGSGVFGWPGVTIAVVGPPGTTVLATSHTGDSWGDMAWLVWFRSPGLADGLQKKVFGRTGQPEHSVHSTTLPVFTTDPTAVPVLIELANDEDPAIRRGAMAALGELGTAAKD